MPVVGTAGHVDHGKSTLTAALSGCDPDRWREEKERGLTIDLGFAWTTLDGIDVSFVDVPGHERYSKNMLAGIEAIDVALLVVAADEGWMPQSEEHLAVLDLLGVPRAVIALTKTDRVDSDLVELATLEIEEKVAGTTIAGAPIIGVSAVSGAGLEELRAALGAAVADVGLPETDRPRMWVDRVFSAPGAGTIVTGTLLGGAVSVEERLQVHPGERECRVRGIQSHEQSYERIDPRRRVALNLGGLSADEVDRGSMLGRPNEWRSSDRVTVSFQTARYVEDLANRGAYHLHVGSGAWPVRVRTIDDGVAVLDISQPLPLAMGDRFILRDTGRRLVVAGGRILDPHPPRPSKLRPHLQSLRAALDAGPHARADALLAVRGRESATTLAADSGGGVASNALAIAGSVLTTETAEELEARLESLVTAHHREHPLRAGLPAAEAASRLGVPPEIVTVLVNRTSSLVLDAAVIRSTSFSGVRSESQEEVWQRTRQQLEEAGPAAVPKIDELELEPELVHALVREGELVRISEDFVFLPTHVDDLLGIVRSFDSPFTVSEFRERSGLSRKYSVPFLEWSDHSGHTVRQGDTRRHR